MVFHGIPEVLKTGNGPRFSDICERERFRTPAYGHLEGFMKNLGNVTRTPYSQGKDWRRELYVFLANCRATLHPSSGKSPYRLFMNRAVRIKLPTIMETTPDPEAMQKDKNSKAKVKAYANQKRQVKPVVVKQRRFNKASPHLEPVPYTVLDVKGSMITARRATDQKEVTRKSSHFEKLTNPPGSTIPDTEPVPVDKQLPFDSEGPEVCQPASTSASQKESSHAHPSETNGNQDNTTLAATE